MRLWSLDGNTSPYFSAAFPDFSLDIGAVGIYIFPTYTDDQANDTLIKKLRIKGSSTFPTFISANDDET